MKIAIDLNDVIRAYTSQFATHYIKNIDREFDIDNVDIWTNDLQQIFPFQSKKAYLDFLYNDCPQEIFGFANQMSKNLCVNLNDWLNELENLEEESEICIVSTKEYDKSIGSSLFFISKFALKIREIHMLLKEEDVFSKCDVVITANPNIISITPEDKKCVKIKTTYNEETDCKLTYDTLTDLMNDKEFINKIKQ